MIRHQSRNELVRYCPGDAIGSPAWMPRPRAERQETQDNDYLDSMERVGLPRPQRPHIGGECTKCQRGRQ